MKQDIAPVGEAVIRETKNVVLRDGRERIHKCLGMLSEEDVWYRPNENVVSVGNLVLHLCGNVTQWIVSGLGGAPDRRNRDGEFSEKGPISKAELLQRLDETLDQAEQTLNAFDPARVLDDVTIQGEDTNVMYALIHVAEHFSYHVGEITYFTKSRKNVDTGYYAGRDLNRLNPA